MLKFHLQILTGVQCRSLRVTRLMVAWIGRDGTITWPPPFPGLTPLDVSVWGIR